MSNVDKLRKAVLATAEFVDAWRVAPRLLVIGWGYVLYKVIVWYMNLESYVVENCPVDVLESCIVHAPNTQHATLVTALVGASAAVFAFYTNSGRKWNGFTAWNKKDEKSND